MKKRVLYLVVLVLALAGVFALYWFRAKQQGHESETLPQIEIGTFSKALSYAPLYVAKHLQWFREDSTLARSEVVFKEFNDRPAISAALTAGELDFLFSAEVPAIMCVAQGNPLRLLEISSSATQKVLVRSDSGIANPSGLRSMRLAVLQGTSSHYGLLKILRTAGLKEQDVTLIYMPPPEAKAAFESGQLDAWAVWAPFVEQQEISGRGREIGGEGAWIHSIVTAPPSLIAEYGEVSRAVANVIRRAKGWIQENPEKAQRIVADEMGIDISVVQKAWPKFTWNASLSAAVLTDMQEKAVFLAENEKTRAGRRVVIRDELLPK